MKRNPKLKVARQIAAYLAKAQGLVIDLPDSPERAVLGREIERAQNAIGNVLALMGDISGYKDGLAKDKQL